MKSEAFCTVGVSDFRTVFSGARPRYETQQYRYYTPPLKTPTTAGGGRHVVNVFHCLDNKPEVCVAFLLPPRSGRSP